MAIGPQTTDELRDAIQALKDKFSDTPQGVVSKLWDEVWGIEREENKRLEKLNLAETIRQIQAARAAGENNPLGDQLDPIAEAVAVAAGLPAELARRLKGNTVLELEADAVALAGELGIETPSPARLRELQKDRQNRGHTRVVGA